jgi:outer membrane protein insertion porin family
MDHMRYSVGLGIDWTTPFGPISVSFAKPIQKSDTDQTQFFQFSLGKTF